MDKNLQNLILLLYLRRRKRQRQNRRMSRWWIHPTIQMRFEQDAYENLIVDLRRDPEIFQFLSNVTQSI